LSWRLNFTKDPVITRDERNDYGEDRYVAFWKLNDRLHVLCFTLRAPEEMRVISLRKASAREIKAYEKIKHLTNASGEFRGLTQEDLKHLKHAAEVLPAEFLKQFKPKGRGPQRMPKKELTTIRLSASVLQAFRATGPRWQTRIDRALKQWVMLHLPEPSAKTAKSGC